MRVLALIAIAVFVAGDNALAQEAIARGLNARRPGADNNKIERTVFNQSGVAVGRFKSFQNSVAELDRIHESVEGKRMLLGPGSVEIVDGRSPGQHQVIVRGVVRPKPSRIPSNWFQTSTVWCKPRSDQTCFSARCPWAFRYLTLGLFS